MTTLGRPRKAIQTVAKTFKITPDQDRMLDKIVANQEPRKEEDREIYELEDRSHIVRLALENYFIEFYEKVLKN